MIKVRTKQVIDVNDWDTLVQETYGKPYSFQQQDGCKERQHVSVTVPDEPCDYENVIVPEVVNHREMGVSFAAWLVRDPVQKISGGEYSDIGDWKTRLWWERNFYPDVSMVANDLHEKGLLEAGEYYINVDW